MNDTRILEGIVGISSTPSIVKELSKRALQPDELDEVTKNLGIPAFLLNFYLATSVDLSSIGLGNVVHIPVQITKREGGRKSLYYLNPGEATLAGIYVTNQGIALRFMERVTGRSLPAQTGDVYFERITNREGEVISQREGTLEIVDPLTGTGKFHFKRLDGVLDDVLTCLIHSQVIHLGGHHQEAKVLEMGNEQAEDNASTLVEMGNKQAEDSASTLHIYITEEPLTASNLTTILSALTELLTKCWLIANERFTDLVDYSLTHSPQIAEEANIIVTRAIHNSPIAIDLKVDISPEGFTEGITKIALIRKRIEREELENQKAAQAIKHDQQLAEQEQQAAQLERERQELIIERQRLEVLEKRLEIQKKGMEYALEVARELVDALQPNADQAVKAMAIHNLLPNILQLQSGKGFELALPAP